MTRTFVSAAVLFALVSAPLAAQTSPSSGTSPPASRYRLQGPTKSSSQPSTNGQAQTTNGQRQALGPAAPAPTRRTATDGNVRPAGDTQPIREPGAGQIPPRKPPGGHIPGTQPLVDAPPQQPVWFPLDPKVQEWLDRVLIEWERTSEKVHYYECTFQKWQFDPVFGPTDRKTPRYFSKGEIKYQFPDKGLFRDVSVWEKVAAPPADAKPKAKPKPGEPPPGWIDALEIAGEHWVCDGKSVYQYHSDRKELIQTILPEEMQGKSIIDGPLPFLFGAKAAVLKQRYWIRPLQPPEGVDHEYWLEAVPRSRQDAQNFQKVQVVLAKEDFFPSKLSVFPPNYNAKTNPARQDYTFAERKAILKGDPRATLDQLTRWRRQFYEPKLPGGWKKVPMTLAPAPLANGPQLPPPQARQPKAGVKAK